MVPKTAALHAKLLNVSRSSDSHGDQTLPWLARSGNQRSCCDAEQNHANWVARKLNAEPLLQVKKKLIQSLLQSRILCVDAAPREISSRYNGGSVQKECIGKCSHVAICCIELKCLTSYLKIIRSVATHRVYPELAVHFCVNPHRRRFGYAALGIGIRLLILDSVGGSRPQFFASRENRLSPVFH